MTHHQSARKRAVERLSDAEQLAAARANLTRLRAEAAAHIERLIELLDLTDDYAATELEDAVDDTACDEDERDDDTIHEPSLGWPDGRIGQFQCGNFDDREQAIEPRAKLTNYDAFLKRHYSNVKPIPGAEWTVR